MKEGYIIFRIDYDVQIIFFICKKWENIGSNTGDVIKGEFYKQKEF